jgi:hypothetical protein
MMHQYKGLFFFSFSKAKAAGNHTLSVLSFMRVPVLQEPKLCA